MWSLYITIALYPKTDSFLMTYEVIYNQNCCWWAQFWSVDGLPGGTLRKGKKFRFRLGPFLRTIRQEFLFNIFLRWTVFFGQAHAILPPFPPLHNVVFVYYDSPLSQNWNPFSWLMRLSIFLFYHFFLGWKLEKKFCFLFSGTRNIRFGTLKTGNNDLEIANLAFESHSFLKIHVCLPIEHWEKCMLNADLKFVKRFTGLKISG